MRVSPLRALLARARGPLGPPVDAEFGIEFRPFVELGMMLSRCNGFLLFGSGVQVYRVGRPGDGPELLDWNGSARWKHSYAELADGLFCFGQDVLGTQFALRGNNVVAFHPETALAQVLGPSLEHWAAWLLADPALHGTGRLASTWQRRHGPLDTAERLVPLRFLVYGGRPTLDNLAVRSAAEAMRIRGPIAKLTRRARTQSNP